MDGFVKPANDFANFPDDFAKLVDDFANFRDDIAKLADGFAKFVDFRGSAALFAEKLRFSVDRQITKAATPPISIQYPYDQ